MNHWGAGDVSQRWEQPRSFAVVVTHDRPDALKLCLEAIAPQVDVIILVDNSEAWQAIAHADELPSGRLRPTIILPDVEHPPNLSRLWNRGLDVADRLAVTVDESWYVAVLNDDAIVPLGWFDAVSLGMKKAGAVAGCSGPITHLLTKPEPVNLHYRMTGWAFILNGSEGLRADERFQWWAGDDDLDWQARRRGGMFMLGSHLTQNLYPNGSMTPELQVQAGKDMASFQEKWGIRPW